MVLVVKGSLAFATEEKEGAWLSSPPPLYLCHAAQCAPARRRRAREGFVQSENECV